MSENEFLPGTIRDRIVDLKRMTNINNKTIAEKTGISESLLSRIESGKQQSVTLHDTLHFCRYSFSSVLSKTQKMSFAKTNEKKKRTGAAHEKCDGFGSFFNIREENAR